MAAQPVNQVHERVDRERELGIEPRFDDQMAELVGEPGWEGVFTFRIGYPTEPAPTSPRRPVREVACTR